MCELHAYLVRGDKEELLVLNVETVESAGEDLAIRDIYGQRYRLAAHIQEINMVTHRVLLVEDFSGGRRS